MRFGGQGKKRDANEPEIIAALQDIGVTVVQLAGNGVPDLLCHSRGIWSVMEIKSDKGKLKPAQAALYQQAPFPIVRNVAEALALFGVRA